MAESREPKALVAADLGEQIASQYDEAVLLTARGSAEGATEEVEAKALELATDVIVEALKDVPSEKVHTAGYAELLLAYGKALMVHVRREMQSENVLSANVEKDINNTSARGDHKFIDVADGAVDDEIEVVDDKQDGKGGKEDENGGDGDGDKVENPDNVVLSDDLDKHIPESNTKPDAEAAETKIDPVANEESAAKEMKSEGDRDAKDTTDEVEVAEAAKDDPDEEDEEDISTAELAWEQFEHARIIIQSLGPGFEGRLSAVQEVQGDFLSESDGNDIRAAEEYQKAAEAAMKADGIASRRVADLYHRKYLVLRKGEPIDAIHAMEKAIDAFKSFVESGEGNAEDSETLVLMRQDLAVFKESLGSALTTVIGFRNQDTAKVPGENGNADFEGIEVTEVIPVPREIIPVTVKPKRRATPTPVPVPDTGKAAENGSADGNGIPAGTGDEPAEKRRKLSTE